MPDYNEDAQLDTSQIEDVRGRRGGFGPIGRAGGGGIPGGGITVGGGAIGIIVLILAVLLGGGVIDQGGTSVPGGYGRLNDQSFDGQGGGGQAATECRTGDDANRREDCRIVLFVNSVQKYWRDEFAQRGVRYQPARTQFFTGGTRTDCGQASSAVGPFYCPADEKVYIDLQFFDELRRRFGLQVGQFAQAYVIAHEYGHHIQNLLGLLREGRPDDGPQGEAVRTELQADCFAGVWAKNAAATGFLTLTADDIPAALDAAAAVGDDRIQQQTQGRVNKETWTHGSSEQRKNWFTRGYQSGDIGACDTSRGTV